MLLSGKFSEKLEFNYNLNVEVKWKLVIRQIDRQTLTGSYRPKNYGFKPLAGFLCLLLASNMDVLHIINFFLGLQQLFENEEIVRLEHF